MQRPWHWLAEPVGIVVFLLVAGTFCVALEAGPGNIVGGFCFAMAAGVAAGTVTAILAKRMER